MQASKEYKNIQKHLNEKLINPLLKCTCEFLTWMGENLLCSQSAKAPRNPPMFKNLCRRTKYIKTNQIGTIFF